ncbi:C-GCAxxG-C-C family (seleno)protein [Clostridium sp. UBA2485]|uniref:C-GCAxxG-C-C family (seleno)protein n=1 Tax=Clostridium sp. UBA2485 TaxID=1946352 RepID=UPI0025BE5B1F|nr:C-GCAxxG-C-C family (seleno)protein [Clostridium sp. UBA2485]
MEKKQFIDEVRHTAEGYFERGEFFCSEAVVKTINDMLDKPYDENVTKLASGFPVGIGKSKCTCGAVNGAVLCLGYFFGRTKGSNPQDPKSVKALELAYELQDSFRQKHKCLCCSVHTKGMDMASGEHKAQCIKFTGEMAEKAAEIIVRELNIENIDE